jgi:hypothetical protein
MAFTNYKKYRIKDYYQDADIPSTKTVAWRLNLSLLLEVSARKTDLPSI